MNRYNRYTWSDCGAVEVKNHDGSWFMPLFMFVAFTMIAGFFIYNEFIR